MNKIHYLFLTFVLVCLNFKALCQDSTILIGKIRYESFNRNQYSWFACNYKKLNNESKDIERIKSLLSDSTITLILFAGTWCSDTQDLLPKIFSILDTINFPSKRIQLYFLDRDKNSGTKAESKYNITLLPTLIITQRNKEIGRITESVNYSVQADLIQILK